MHSQKPRPKPKPHHRIPSQTVQHDVVDPTWLLKAIGFTLAAALFCGYLTLCLLFYQGQWQLVLHPTRTTSSPASIAGIPYELIHFGPDESAVPQLTGWWIPAAAAARYANSTILFLAGADGSLANSIPTLATLHNNGINIFAFDYRGYGQSAPSRPNQQNVVHDANSAWQYLTTSRAIPQQRIVPYGFNIGASLAVHLAVAHPSIPAIIIDAPYADLLDAAQHDPRSRLIPVCLLFHERFPLAEPLSTLHTPKLLLSRSPSADKSFQTAADPKIFKSSTYMASSSETSFSQGLSTFLDEYLPSSVTPQSVPSPGLTH
jgi:pimeloyl-ACP methyl ester carboxylesterase